MKNELSWLTSIVVFAYLIIRLAHSGGVRPKAGSSNQFNDTSLKSAAKLTSHVQPLSNQTLTQASTSAKATPSSTYAYVTLLHGIDDSFKYRGFLYNTLIMKQSLDELGSKHDFIALIGFANSAFNENRILFEQDLKLLESAGILLHFLPRIKGMANSFRGDKISFAEMALLKITPWSFTQYTKVQYFDGDIMPIQNMDCFFELPGNTFNTGLASPLNSGWSM
jgi:hypothetical protein